MLALTLAMLLASAVAWAETLTITLTTPGGPLTATRIISGADLNKLQTAYSAGMVAAGNATPTTGDVFTEMTKRWVASTIDYVRDYYNQQAKAAVSSIVVQ